MSLASSLFVPSSFASLMSQCFIRNKFVTFHFEVLFLCAYLLLSSYLREGLPTLTLAFSSLVASLAPVAVLQIFSLSSVMVSSAAFNALIATYVTAFYIASESAIVLSFYPRFMLYDCLCQQLLLRFICLYKITTMAGLTIHSLHIIQPICIHCILDYIRVRLLQLIVLATDGCFLDYCIHKISVAGAVYTMYVI